MAKRLVTPIEAGLTEETFDDPFVLEGRSTPFYQFLLRARKAYNERTAVRVKSPNEGEEK